MLKYQIRPLLNGILFIVLVSTLMVKPLSSIGQIKGPAKVSLSIGRSDRSTMISNYNYNDYVALTEDPYDFRENDFIDFNQEGEIRRRRRQLDFFFDRIAKEDAKLHKSWLFGIGINDFSQFSIFILKEIY